MLDQVLTLVTAAPGALDGEKLDAIREAFFKLGAETAPARWLAQDLACDIEFAALNPDQADAAARGLLTDAPVDIIAQPLADRRKDLLLADMESTLIHNEMLDELADFVGLRAEIAAVTARAMNGELDFEAALDARVALLKGLPVATLDEAAKRITLMPGARTLVATMRRHGAHCVVVSGGFRFFTGLVRGWLGLDEDYANVLEIDSDCLTGSVTKPVLGREAKFDTLIRLASERHVPLSRTLAVGDGANDIDMLLAAGLGVAFHAKPAVAARAKHRVAHTDLETLLYAQGYRREDFAV